MKVVGERYAASGGELYLWPPPPAPPPRPPRPPRSASSDSSKDNVASVNALLRRAEKMTKARVSRRLPMYLHQ